MSVLPVGFASASGVDVGDIGHSLRLRSAASARLARTPSAAPTRRQVTFSFWFKRGTLGAAMRLFQTRDNGVSSGNAFGIYLNAANDLDVYQYSSAYTLLFRTSAVFRDPTSWNHLVVAIDTTQATSADRVKLYLNGVSLTSSTYTAPALNLDLYWDSAVQHNIGCFDYTGSYSNFFDGEFARIAVVSQQQLTPEDFGYQNTEINEWVSKSKSAVKAVVDAGGTNSFMLDFDNATSLTTLGYDKSSKGNNWTLNNFSLTAGSTYDWMLDVPGNSYCTASSIDLGANPASSTLSEANLKSVCAAVSGGSSTCGTQALPAGKWYWEYIPTAIGDGLILGITSRTSGTPSGTAVGYVFDGQKSIAGTASSYGSSYAANDIIGVAVDTTANTIEFFKNSTSQGVITNATYVVPGCKPVHWNNSSSGSSTVQHMYGQAPLHASATYHSAAGGYFRYAPPTGYKALCQANLPDPAILNPELHHNVVLDTGANIKTTSEAVYPSNFLEWIKDRANANNHQLIDTVRGSSAVLQSNTTAAETTYTAPSGNSVGWAWKAGGAAVTNNAGSISSQVSANVDAGFSIVTATLTATNQTIGHGVGAVPKFIVGFKRNGTSSHPCYHSGLSSAANVVYLDTTAAQAASATTWNSTAPTSTVFSVGTGLTGDWVFYCFAETPGYSKIGSYTGNGSADGPYVECGFKPKFIMYKRSDAASNWVIWDSVRSPDNVVNDYLLPNSSGAEATLDTLDITSNGFKLRTSNADNNGGTIIFYAVADVPAKYSLAR